MKSKYVFLGGGMVAGYAAKELVERGLRPGELTIVSADTSVPYERPPLSKGFLAGKDTEESVRISPAEFYSQHGIELLLNREVKDIDTTGKVLHLSSGADLAFEKLVLATGAEVRTLDVPGSNLSGIHYLRSLDDSKKIRSNADAAKNALVIGGGFISMEVASVLAQKGLKTAMLLREDRVWKRLFTPAMSRFFEEYYADRGVRLIKQAEVKELRGDSAVSSAVLTNGQTVECDLVVAGLGVKPVTDLIAAAGIKVDDGVVVNEYLETGVPGIYAAGDVANYRDTIFGKRRRVEHWDNAVSQGQHVARVLMGDRKPFVHVPYFFSDVFDLSYEFWGDTADATDVVERGDVSSSSFSVWWFKEKRVIAAFTMNRPDDERTAAPRWIESKQTISPETVRAVGPLDAGDK
jgi:NADPH-dependent 2,4-dienoyl-CoA reductase/sulfur reductase-like enzyme